MSCATNYTRSATNLHALCQCGTGRGREAEVEGGEKANSLLDRFLVPVLVPWVRHDWLSWAEVESFFLLLSS